jgi:hypothetical protein
LATQRHYSSDAPFAEQLDVHWSIAVPHLFRNAVTFDELQSQSIPIPALGTAARTLSYPDALFLACLHRVAHHQDADDLLWLWDVHLLASRLSSAERTRFIDLAVRASMRSICIRGLALAGEQFGTSGAAELIEALQSPTGKDEPAARFLERNLRQVDVFLTDLEVLPSWRARVALVSEYLFPSAAYMRSAYPGFPGAVLPVAYLWRIARGMPKWFRRAR